MHPRQCVFAGGKVRDEAFFAGIEARGSGLLEPEVGGGEETSDRIVEDVRVKLMGGVWERYRVELLRM